ncbi:MAG: retroviral-like aspartic protease family protein [Sterolibacterium sp.]|nr:retroviral-like aspartic protease family protein [Sterolibacterium sp.]
MSLAQKHFLAALVWCALLGAAYLVLGDQLRPKVAQVEAGAHEVRIPRSRDGHFYVAGRIGGHPVNFMVDTGASSVAVNPATARQLALPRGQSVRVQTAGGETLAEEVAGQQVAIGGIVVPDVRVLVLPQMTTDALLGQNVLRYLEVQQTARQMQLRARAAY